MADINLRTTNAGALAIRDGANVGLGAVRVTRMAVGSGFRAPDGTETELETQTDSAAVTGIYDDGQITGEFQFSGAEILTVREMGLYGRIGADGAEFMLAYASSAAGDVLTTKSAAEQLRVAFAWVINIDGTAAEIIIDAGDTVIRVGGNAETATEAETIALQSETLAVAPAHLPQGIDAAFAQDSRSGIILPRHYATWRNDDYIQQLFVAGFSLTKAAANNRPQAAVGAFRSSGNLTRRADGAIIQPEGAISWFGCDARETPPIGGAFLATVKVEDYHPGGIIIALVDSTQTTTAGHSINPNLFFDINHRLHFTSGGHDSSSPQHVFINTPINPNRRVEVMVMAIRHSAAEWRIRFAWRQGTTFHQSAVISGYTPAQMGDMRLVRFGADPFDLTVNHGNAGGECIDAINGVLPVHLSTLENVSIEDFYIGDLRTAYQSNVSPIGRKYFNLNGHASPFRVYEMTQCYGEYFSISLPHHVKIGSLWESSGENFSVTKISERPANADVITNLGGGNDNGAFWLLGPGEWKIFPTHGYAAAGRGYRFELYEATDGEDNDLLIRTLDSWYAPGIHEGQIDLPDYPKIVLENETVFYTISQARNEASVAQLSGWVEFQKYN